MSNILINNKNEDDGEMLLQQNTNILKTEILKEKLTTTDMKEIISDCSLFSEKVKKNVKDKTVLSTDSDNHLIGACC